MVKQGTFANTKAMIHQSDGSVSGVPTELDNPEGIEAQSPGLRGTSYPGGNDAYIRQPQRGCGKVARC